MKPLFIFLAINLLMTISCLAQVNVNLKIDESKLAVFGESLFCNENSPCGLSQNEQSKTDSDFGQEKILMKVERNGKDFSFFVDTNLDNQLTDNEKFLIKSRSSIIIRLNRKPSTGEVLNLPYQISHDIDEKAGSITDEFTINSYFALAGILSYKNCTSKISLTDMNYDGSFSLKDSRGTNLGIDFNNDGKFQGRAELKRTSEIIEFCGESFLVSALSNNQMTLTPTELRIARVNTLAPSFSLTLLNNRTLTTDNLKGKYYLIDFWASWCVPCVNNLSQIVELERKYKNKVSIISVNVDVASKKALAEKIINEKQLFEFSVIRGMGDNDPLWKVMSGTNLFGISIPLYVLVDKDGIIKYIGSGGEDLAEVKNQIEKDFVE